MALITWSEALSTGVKKFDEEHKQLIAMANELHSAMGAGKGKDVMAKILSGLVQYTKEHFSSEETLMQKFGYPGYGEHKAKHSDLTRTVTDLDQKVRDGKAIVTVDVMTFLKDWLSNHIQGTDKQYGPFLKSKGVA